MSTILSVDFRFSIADFRLEGKFEQIENPKSKIQNC